MCANESGRVVVLLIEDDEDDQMLTQRALQNDALRIDLRTVSDGEEAMNYLNRQGRYDSEESAPRPGFILLDLNLPRLSGQEVLERIRGDGNLRQIPVIILTTSKREADVIRTYDLGCNSFVTKPVRLNDFLEAVRELGTYWADLVTLPCDSVP